MSFHYFITNLLFCFDFRFRLGGGAKVWLNDLLKFLKQSNLRRYKKLRSKKISKISQLKAVRNSRRKQMLNEMGNAKKNHFALQGRPRLLMNKYGFK